MPEIGKVKTRLAADVGDKKALDIYKALLFHTKNVSANVNAQRNLYYATTPMKDDWDTSLFIKSTQQGDDLGERMQNAFSEVIKKAEKVLIIGSDCPQLSADVLEKAFEILDHKDLVIGPTFDGGYYLLGMKEAHSFLFENMPWSTNSVFLETINRAEKNFLAYEALETLSDVDYKEDWDQYGWEL